MLTVIVCLVVITIFAGIAAKAGSKYYNGDWARTDALVILNFSAVVIVVAVVLLLREALKSDGTGWIP
ncbi:hypothetical protein [Paenibacillus sp. MMO-177]|uniref:hypothetical protein n=1 Tax=Paenibacillus sp. MMO-177 TaxID=3081289 RepID=UPI00301657F7